MWDAPKDGCLHQWGNELKQRQRGTTKGKNAQVGNQINEVCGVEIIQGQFCSLCGAWRGSLGLEPTFQLYLDHLMQIMSECKRVLKSTGTMWVVIGDSYSGSGKAGSNPEYQKRHTEFGKPSTHAQRFGMPTTNCEIPTKSLIGIPERFAIEMSNPNWVLRDDLSKEERIYVLTELAKNGIL